MEEDKKLYPFSFARIDGKSGETVHIADLGYQDSMVRNGWLKGNTISEVMDMYMDRVVGEAVFAEFGRQFPVLVKEIDCKGATTLCVHPDDVTAAERYDFLGKAKLWYVTDVRKGSKLFLGFKRDVTAEEFYNACLDGTAETLLNAVTPRVGEHYLIAPGLVNAAKDVKLVEVAESSPLDFQLYNWGETLEGDEIEEGLTLVEALDFIDFKKCGNLSDVFEVKDCHRRLTDRKEFKVNEVRLDEPLRICCSEGGSFSVYSCVYGGMSVQVPSDTDGVKGMERYEVRAGESVLVPAEVDEFFLVPDTGGTVMLEVICN